MTTREVVVPVKTARVLLSALVKAGARPRLAEDPREFDKAIRVVAPCDTLQTSAGHWTLEHRLALRTRIAAGRSTLTVASLTAFLLSPSAQELPHEKKSRPEADAETRADPQSTGQAAPPGQVPGWSQIVPGLACRFVRSGWAFFESCTIDASWLELAGPAWVTPTTPANAARNGWSVAHLPQAGTVPAAYEQGSVLLCLFRPDLSSQWGLQVLQRWLGAD